MNLVQAIRVARTDGHDYEITWTPEFSAEPLDIYAGTRPDAIDLESPHVQHAVGRASISGLEPGIRHYFRLRGADGTDIVVAQRDVPLEGAVNFRDLGGYPAADRRRVRWGRLFRSGHMANLTAAGLAQLRSLRLDTVCDFRLTTERAHENTSLPEGIRLETLEIPPGVGDPQYFHRVFREAKDPKPVVDAVHEVVRSMVARSAPRYQRLFEVLLEPGERNILINCSAGKERTGVGSALILTALGVPRKTIYYDFMLSRDYFPAEQEIPRVLAKYEVGAVGEAARQLVMPLLETRESYLRAAFDYIDDNFGNGIEFLRAQYGLGDAEFDELRARYTV